MKPFLHFTKEQRNHQRLNPNNNHTKLLHDSVWNFFYPFHIKRLLNLLIKWKYWPHSIFAKQSLWLAEKTISLSVALQVLRDWFQKIVGALVTETARSAVPPFFQCILKMVWGNLQSPKYIVTQKNTTFEIKSHLQVPF